jgi:phospholipid/cholesterol/gamma-HCH transport system substrate-binding protein
MNDRRLELFVGLFLIVGLFCLAYLSINLGDLKIWGPAYYDVYANFSTVGNLRPRAPVTMAGVEIGQVKEIQLVEGQARVTLNVRSDVRLSEDSIVSIKTAGIIGERFVSISPGASDEIVSAGGTIRDTQPPLDIESLLGKFVFGSMEEPELK